MSQAHFHIDGVVSMDLNQGIGYQNQLLVRLKKDMQWFRQLTTWKDREEGDIPNGIVMGRKTWDSIPDRNKPLSNRINYVLSRKIINKNTKDLQFFSNWDDLLQEAQKNTKQLFVIGGEEIFNQVLQLKEFRYLYVTQFQAKFKADTFFPPFKKIFIYRKIIDFGIENQVSFKILRYKK